MSAIDTLIDEFPGENSWSKFFNVFKTSWDDFKDNKKFAKQIGNEEIAVVLHAKMGAAAIEWMLQPIGALDRQSARQVLTTHPLGEMVIKSLIMRMPV